MLYARLKPCQLTKFKFGKWRPVREIEEIENIFGTIETIVWYADNSDDDLNWDYIFNVEIKEESNQYSFKEGG